MRTAARTLIALLLLVVSPALARAVWEPGGNLLCSSPGDQWAVDCIADGAGGAYILWVDVPTNLLHLQRVTSAGDPALDWPACGLTVSANAARSTVGPIPGPSKLVLDSAGGVYVSWATAAPRQLRVKRYTASGSVAVDWPADGAIAAAVSTIYQLDATPDGQGGLFLAASDASARGFVQHIQADTTRAPGWPANGISLTTTGAFALSVVSDGGTGAIVAWSDNRTGGGNFDLYAQHFASNGALAPGWPATGRALSAMPGAQGGNLGDAGVCCVTDDAGGAIVAFLSGGAGGGAAPRDVYAQRVTGDGVIPSGWPADGVPLCTVAGDQRFGQLPSAIADGTGGAIVVWNDLRSVNPGLYAQRVTSGGGVGGCWPLDGQPVSTRVPGFGCLAPDGSGGAIVAWPDSVGPTTRANFATRFTSDGGIAPGWSAGGALVDLPFSRPNFSRITNVESAQVIVASGGQSPSMADADPYAQSLPIGPAPESRGGYWRFETMFADTVPDESGHHADAQLVNGARLSPEVRASSVRVEGDCLVDVGSLHVSADSSQAAVAADGDALRPCSGLTLEVIFRPEPAAWVLVGKQLGGGCCTNSYQIEIVDGTTRFTLSDPTGVGHQAVWGMTPPIGEWSHLAGTWDGTTQRLYFNGVEVASNPFAGPIGYDANPLIIGADDDGNGVPGCCFFNGLIDEVRLSDRALPPEEFLAICVPSAVPTTRMNLPLVAQPTVTRDGTTVRFGRALTGSGRAIVFDARGRWIHGWPLHRGDDATWWDGRAEDGRQVPTGIYWIRILSPELEGNARVVVLR